MMWLDPIRWLGEDSYNNFAGCIINALFNGILARILALAFLLGGTWFIFRRKQTAAGIAFIGLSGLIIFGRFLIDYLW